MTNLLLYFQNRPEILGMNERVFSYQSLNAGRFDIADNKIKTKRILKNADIPVPGAIAIIRNRQQLDELDFEKLPKSFVIKPARGFKGAGINIYYNRSKDGRWILADKSKHSIDDIKQHIQNILDGQYSLSLDPKPSVAIVEERVQMAKEFKYYSYRGIPDIRVIVYNHVPVMAMLRLPTKESEGKANISRGAIGVGIDMARGVTTTAIKKGRSIEYLPGTQIRLSGIRIPYWNKILRLSSECQKASGLNYIGVDIIIDKEKGPLVIELNARPGLSIQVANGAGLKERLQRVKKLKIKTTEKAVRLAKDLFGGEIEEEIETLSGREVIGLEEEITLFGKDGKEKKVFCKIDTGAESSSIDTNLMRELGYEGLVEHYEETIGEEQVALLSDERRKQYMRKLYEHPEVTKVSIIKSASGYDYRVRVDVPAQIHDKKFVMHANIADRNHMDYKVLLGKRNLKSFFIDTTIKSVKK